MATTNRKSAKALTASKGNARREGGGNSSTPGLEQQVELQAGIVPPEMIGIDLAPAAAAMLDWATPAARDWRTQNSEEHGHHGDQLPNQAVHGTKLSKGFTGERSSPLDPATKRAGKSTTALSPFFVEALMGMPLGLTDLTASTTWATESFRSWRLAHLSSLRRGF
jgi:hypothetical protein